jgi:hypothetical protein
MAFLNPVVGHPRKAGERRELVLRQA